MANHSARTHLKCARSIMQGFDYPDDSPGNIIDLRDKLGLTTPSPSTIQRMFGARVELAQWSKSGEVLELFNRERQRRSLPAIGRDHIIHFNSMVAKIGILLQEAERKSSATDDVR